MIEKNKNKKISNVENRHRIGSFVLTKFSNKLDSNINLWMVMNVLRGGICDIILETGLEKCGAAWRTGRKESNSWFFS